MPVHLGKMATPDGETVVLEVDQTPDHCPFCHKGILATIHNSQHCFLSPGGSLYVASVFTCPRSSCQQPFFGYYFVSHADDRDAFGKLSRTAPVRHQATIFPPGIQQVSPRFVEIYNQADQALALALDEIAGPGFRKALECLIKDFLIYGATTQEEKDKIRNEMMLGQCIKQFPEHSDLREVAEGATWIGNDETHYQRHWHAKDISDLIKYTQATATYIQLKLDTEQLKRDKQVRKAEKQAAKAAQQAAKKP